MQKGHSKEGAGVCGYSVTAGAEAIFIVAFFGVEMAIPFLRRCRH